MMLSGDKHPDPGQRVIITKCFSDIKTIKKFFHTSFGKISVTGKQEQNPVKKLVEHGFKETKSNVSKSSD